MFKQNLKNGPKVNNTGKNKRNINPIPYTNDKEDLSLNITPVEIKIMKDTTGDIRFHKMIEHLLPRFKDTEAGQQSLWKWQAAHMRNYMNYLILHYGYKSKYYNPYVDKKDQVKEIEDIMLLNSMASSCHGYFLAIL